MKNYLSLLTQCDLFAQINPDDLPGVLGCLGIRNRVYYAGELILHAGDAVSSAGMVLRGTSQIIKEDINGNRTIVAELVPGDLFAEALACAHVQHSPVGVLAIAPSEVLWIDLQRIVGVCENACSFHTQLISNLLRILAQKSLLLSGKIDILSLRTTREKILAFLTHTSHGRKAFSIPFSRAELADYLCVDRSAMSRELSRMTREGLLSFHKDHFELP